MRHEAFGSADRPVSVIGQVLHVVPRAALSARPPPPLACGCGLVRRHDPHRHRRDVRLGPGRSRRRRGDREMSSRMRSSERISPSARGHDAGPDNAGARHRRRRTRTIPRRCARSQNGPPRPATRPASSPRALARMARAKPPPRFEATSKRDGQILSARPVPAAVIRQRRRSELHLLGAASGPAGIAAAAIGAVPVAPCRAAARGAAALPVAAAAGVP